VSKSHKIKVLGRFRAHRPDGEPIEISSKKALALVTYLAVESGPQPRETLATLLWADTGEERARHNLRQALSKIRHCCESLVAASGDCLELDMRNCDTDLVGFESLASSDDPGRLRECLDLYRGELLEGVNPREPEYADWLTLARSRLRNVACQVADRLGQALSKRGQTGESIKAYCDLLRIDPAHEPAHRALMIQYAQTGRRSDALRQYQSCTEALARELGVKPESETRRLYEELRSEERPAGTGTGGRMAAPPTETSSPPAIAVMPFENLSVTEEAYFADGMAEDLITALSCFHSLVVIARGSSFAFRDSDRTDQDIARELGAQFLVRGSVQRSGSRVRINVQLLDAEAGLQVWGHRYDREMEDVFVLQDEITSTLVSTLAGRVEAARLARARKAPSERLDAHDLLLRGKDHHHRFTPEDCEKCIDLFERAVERDPDYAVAYAWLACGLGQAMVFELDDIPTLVDRCQVAVEKGLSLDENDSECHRVLAQVNLERGNLNRSLQHQERALFLNPNDDRIVNAMGEVLVFFGRMEEAERWVRKSMRLNPYHPTRYWTHLVRALFHQGRVQESLEALDRIDKPRRDDLAYRIAALERKGDAQSAAKTAVRLREEFPEFNPARFVESLPFQRQEDSEALLKPLGLVFERTNHRA
jgi:adenylate cyclase